MSEEEIPASDTGAPKDQFSDGVLNTILAEKGQIDEDFLKELLKALVIQHKQGNILWKGNLTHTIDDSVSNIDGKISQQLSLVFSFPAFRELEGSWRGLHKLVTNSELGLDLKIKLMNATHSELLTQFEQAPTIDRSPLFNIIYQNEFGTAGGEPYGVLLGDMYFSYDDQDITLLRYIGEVAAASHCPFIAATKSNMFELASYKQLAEGRPVASGFSDEIYASWNSFRASDDARYVTLALPRVMARLPYSSKSFPTKTFAFEELKTDSEGFISIDQEKDFVWTNAAYEVGLNMTQAFTEFGWCTAIRGVENGGKVSNLPNFTYQTRSGDIAQQCPVEVNLSDEREKEMSDLGFLPLVHYKGADYAVFIGAQTTQKPMEYVDPDATANAAISARLPYIMASSRIAHYLKVIGRDKIGSSLTPDDVQKDLTTWIGQYTNPNALGNEARAKYPLRESQIQVVEQRGRPGCYSVVAHLRPWLQMEELSVSLRMVAAIPAQSSS